MSSVCCDLLTPRAVRRKVDLFWHFGPSLVSAHARTTYPLDDCKRTVDFHATFIQAYFTKPFKYITYFNVKFSPNRSTLNNQLTRPSDRLDHCSVQPLANLPYFVWTKYKYSLVTRLYFFIMSCGFYAEVLFRNSNWFVLPSIKLERKNIYVVKYRLNIECGGQCWPRELTH